MSLLERKSSGSGWTHCPTRVSVYLLSTRFGTVQRVYAVTPSKGLKVVLFTGKPEHRLSLERAKKGIPYADAERNIFDELAENDGVSAMALSLIPLG